MQHLNDHILLRMIIFSSIKNNHILLERSYSILLWQTPYQINKKSSHKKIIKYFIISNFNKVILSLQKIKNKNLGQNWENLVNFLVKDYNFSNDEAEVLIIDAVNSRSEWQSRKKAA